MSEVFVTDGRALSSLAVARSLGRNGYEVVVGEEFKASITSFSKYVSDSVVYPSPDSEPQAWIEFIEKYLRNNDVSVIVPSRDSTTQLVSKHRDALSDHAAVPVASHDLISKFSDKAKTADLCAELDVDSPTTFHPEGDSVSEIADEVPYPAVIKPRETSGSRGVHKVTSPSELIERYEQVAEEYDRPLIQEYIDHGDNHYSIGTLFGQDSEPKAVHAYRELEQYPSSGGPAIVAESVPAPAWVEEMLRPLTDVGWTGPAHIDVLIDSNTDIPYLLEVNPRFWSSLQLTIESGVDVPALLCRMALSEGDDEIVDSYQTGLRYQWLLPNTVLWSIEQESTLGAIRESISYLSGSSCNAIASFSDPLPVVGVGTQSLTYLMDSEKRSEVLGRAI